MMRTLVAAWLVPIALGAPQHGFSFTTWSSDEYASTDAAQSLTELAATGADSVALITSWYQPNRESTQMLPAADLTPTDQALAVAVAEAKRLGLRVFLRPTVETQDGTPRAGLRPRSVSAWFRSYRTFMEYYASLAQSLGVDMLSVGLEYHTLDGPRHARSWRRVIRAIRARYQGPLTYSAQGADAWTRVRFWDALDVIGIDAYFPLSKGATPGPAKIAKRWSRYLAPMHSLSRREAKRVVLTEVGFPSSVRAAAEPWSTGGHYSGAAQRRAFDGTFRALAGRRWLGGLYIWEWNADPLAGGPGETGHTPQGKPAERSIATWFRRLGR
jgi:hypothetical protein